MAASSLTSVKEQRFILLSIIVLIMTNSLASLFGGSGFEDDIGSGSLSRKMLLGIYLASVYFATKDLAGYLTAIRRTWLLWGLVALSLLSLLWASLPELTFRRSIALTLTTAYGVYVAEKISLSEVLYLLVWVFAVLIVVNLFVIFVFPDYGIHQSKHFGAWRGFFSHKNTFGQMMLIASLLYFTLAMEGDHSHRKYWIWFLVSVILVLKSHSQTSILVLCITCCCTPFLKAIRWQGFLSKTFYISGFIVTAISSYVVSVNIERITAVFGRDATFSGRDRLWSDGLAMIREQPWLGYGFGSEWYHDSWGFIPAWSTNLDNIVELHNGYLELFAQLGIVGGLLYGVLIVFMIIRSVLLVERNDGMAVYWPLYYLIFFSVYNLFEGVLLQQNNFIWIMFVMISVWVTAPLAEE